MIRDGWRAIAPLLAARRREFWRLAGLAGALACMILAAVFLLARLAAGAEFGLTGVAASCVFLAGGIVWAGYKACAVMAGLKSDLAGEWLRELVPRVLFAQKLLEYDRSGGSVVRALDADVQTAASACAVTGPSAVLWSAGLLAPLALAYFIRPEFGVIALLIPVLCFLPLAYQFEKLRAGSARAAAAAIRRLDRILETMRRLDGIKACGREEETAAAYEASLPGYAAESEEDGIAVFAAKLFVAVMPVLLAFFALLRAAGIYSDGYSNPASLFAAVSLIALMAFAVSRIAALVRELARQSVSLACIRRLFESYEPVRRHTGKPLILSGGDIALSGVGLESGGRPVFSRVTLSIPTGKHIAVAGASASGKTAFVRMLAKLAAPQAGRIDIDGQNIYELSLSSFRAKVAFVPETPDIFTGTLEENIRFGAALDGAQLAAAAEAAGLARFIASMPAGLATPVSPGMTELTASVRARIMLARALCGRPRILILDTIMQPLAPFEEAAFFTALRRFSPGMTVIAVAGRRSSAVCADYICALRGVNGVTLYQAGAAGADNFLDGVFGAGAAGVKLAR
ncbi:MAG: ABC transporter ATP-binding protein [Elusimicrobiaceae bacterium]|nr:ABC transporter ATP-binding protein [Elusimicrobiaceae bacterium]